MNFLSSLYPNFYFIELLSFIRFDKIANYILFLSDITPILMYQVFLVLLSCYFVNLVFNKIRNSCIWWVKSFCSLFHSILMSSNLSATHTLWYFLLIHNIRFLFVLFFIHDYLFLIVINSFFMKPRPFIDKFDSFAS